MNKRLRLLILCCLAALSGTTFAAWEKATAIAVDDVLVLAVDNGTVAKELNGISTTATPYGLALDYTDTPAAVYPLTVVAGSTDGSFAFKNAEGKYLVWTSGNSLTVAEEVADASSWTVTFSEAGTADIYNVGTTSRKLQYNAGNPRFACYTSNQTAPIFWKQVAEGTVAKPSLPAATSFYESMTIEITAEEGASVYYTLDGTNPTTESTLYSEPFTLNATTTVKAIAVVNGKSSDVASATYTALEKITIAEAQAASAGTFVVIEGTVVASAANGAVIADGTDYLYYYNNSNALTVGQKVRMAGALASYGGAVQLTSAATITELGSTEVDQPKTTTLTGADFDQIQAAGKVAERKFVSFTGKLSISGSYYNIAIDGAETAVGSIVKPKEDYSALNGKTVVVKGYLMYVNSKYVYAVATSVKKLPVYIESDMTSQFSSLTNWQNWTGATGYTATNFCPAVTTNAGQTVQVCERYVGNCYETGDIFYQTVSGLTPGTYKIELYGGAAFTFGRGFGSTAFTNDDGDTNAEYNAGDHIDSDTGVTLYAETSEGAFGGEIPIYYATDFPEGAAIVTLSGVEVGDNGQVKIGMSKTSTSTNWHVIQLKGVTAQVNAVASYAALVEKAKNLMVSPSYREAINAAIVDDSDFTTAEEYQNAIAAIEAAMEAAMENNALWLALQNAVETANKYIGGQDYEQEYIQALATVVNDANDAIKAQQLEGDGVVALTGRIYDAIKAMQLHPQGDNVDMTFLLNNPDFEADSHGVQQPTGWTAESTSTTGGSLNDGNVRTGGTATNVCFEAWNSSGFDVYQVLENAPLGVYEIEVQGFYRYLRGNDAWNAYQAQEVPQVKKEGVPVYIYMNDNATPFVNVFAEPVEVGQLYTNSVNDDTYTETGGHYWFPNQMNSSAEAFSAGMYKQSAFGLVAQAGETLRLGVKGVSNQGNDSWVIWDNFKLIYRGFKPEVVQPRLEEAMEDVKAYESMLMGKTEFATLSKALADATAAIEKQDGEAMFQALVDIYGVKEAARVSKDAFLEKEVPADTATLAQAIRNVEGVKLSKTTLAATNDLLTGLEENTIYETTEVEQIHDDVLSAIDRLNESVQKYQSLAYALDQLSVSIADAKNYETIDANLIARGENLYNADLKLWDEGTIEDDAIPEELNTIYDLIDELVAAINIATGISQVENGKSSTEGCVYDMQGRRMEGSTLKKGLYIRGGKKVVVK